MGSGLKPTFTPACPKCDFVLKYYARDPQVHPDKWVLSEESRKHLKEAHIAVPEMRKAPTSIRRHRGRAILRLPSSKRRALV